MARDFRFDLEKSMQAIAALLRPMPHTRMNYMRLLKLLYIAERESLKESGKPITGSPVVAMRRGPVLEDIYDLIRRQSGDLQYWDKYFRVDGYHLVMNQDPGSGRLSRFVVKVLADVSSEFKDLDEWAMVEATHEFPEWRANDPGNSSRPISLKDILNAVGRGDDLEQILSSAQNDQRASSAFAP